MSTTFDVAHIQEQGQHIIVIFVASSFGHKSTTEQNEVWENLQACAASAGLAGTVVLVWESGRGRMGFLAPSQWNRFFSSVSLSVLAANINRKLTCG